MKNLLTLAETVVYLRMTSEEREKALGMDAWINQGWTRVESCEEEEEGEEEEWDERERDPYLSDGEADADALSSCGWGTDEDYGYFGGGEW